MLRTMEKTTQAESRSSAGLTPSGSKKRKRGGVRVGEQKENQSNPKNGGSEAHQPASHTEGRNEDVQSRNQNRTLRTRFTVEPRGAR